MSIEFAEILMHPGMMLAMILGLDLLFGDPVYRLHPVRLIGKFLTWYESILRQIGLNGKFGGIILVLLLLCSSLVIGWSIFYLLASLHWSLSWLWYMYLGWSLLALGDLLTHARNVAAAIKEDDLDEETFNEINSEFEDWLEEAIEDISPAESAMGTVYVDGGEILGQGKQDRSSAAANAVAAAAAPKISLHCIYKLFCISYYKH